MALKNNNSQLKNFDVEKYRDDSREENVNISKLNTVNMQKYGANVNLYRMFPDVHDGLKVVERRILYAMYSFGGAAKKAVKVSILSGSVMSIHPHGDTSDTIVRLAQPWNMIIPYVDGWEGNFGTIDGYEAAAPRYIKASLSKYAIDCFFSDFDEKIVSMQQSYNPEYKEPLFLPTKYPNCLLSAADGLGYGEACHIPTYNVQEVLQATIDLIDNPKKDIVLIPDIATGCLIVDDGNFEAISRTGEGKFTMKAEITKDEEHCAILIKSIPFQVSLLNVKEKIKNLIETNVITGFLRMADLSGQAIHLEIYFRKGTDLENVISILYEKTPLRDTFKTQLRMTDDTADKLFSLRGALLRWINIRRGFKRKFFTHKLVANEERRHLLTIILRILNKDNAEKTIKIIKSSTADEVVKKLVKEYDISTLQAKTISRMRLGELNETAYKGYLKEMPEVEENIVKYRKLTTCDNTAVDKIIKEELRDGIKKYSAPRKSRVVKPKTEFAYSDFKVSLVMTKHGYVKKLKQGAEIGKLGDTDEPISYVNANNRDSLILFDTVGDIHTCDIGKFSYTEDRGIGELLSTFIPIRGVPIKAFNLADIKPNSFFVFITKKGNIKKSAVSAYFFKQSVKAIILDKDDELVSVINITKNEDILIYTSLGYGLRFNTNELTLIGRLSKGSAIVKLDKKDFIKGIDFIEAKDEYIFLLSTKGYAKKISVDIFGKKSRRSELVSLITLEGRDTLFTAISCTDSETFTAITNKCIVDIPVENIDEMLKFHSGRLIKELAINKSNQLLSISK